jgi:23S rRNA (uracil1939-C5)-methyltransferase
MIELYVRSGITEAARLRQFAADLAEAIPEIHGVAHIEVDFRKRSEPKVSVLLRERAVEYLVAGARYRVSAGAFFQANRYLLPRMVELAVGDRRGRVALDLYSGVGLFAVPLARKFQRVIAVESSTNSGADLRANVPENVRASLQTTEEYLTSAADTLKVDIVVVDPPRSGLGDQVCRQINKLGASEIVYVSCDPATLARDLKQLTTQGWKISRLYLIDLFPQTFHIETCTVLTR